MEKEKEKDKDKVCFTLRLDRDLARKLDYIAEYYGRNRTSEIIWRLRRLVSNFEQEVEKIEFNEKA